MKERRGYILLHRKGITMEEWKHPERTLAWIDLLTLVDYETGIVTVSYGFLSKRWRISKGTVHFWITKWITERRLERQSERSTERNAERFFVVNYAKYQASAERVTERQSERESERQSEPKKKVRSTPSVESNQQHSVFDEISKHLKRQKGVGNAEAYLKKIRDQAADAAVIKAWSDWKRGNGIESPGDFFSRCLYYHSR